MSLARSAVRRATPPAEARGARPTDACNNAYKINDESISTGKPKEVAVQKDTEAA